METLVLALDLVGTFVFALSGGMAAVRHRLDVFGVLVLAFAAGNAGGMTRDVLIGSVPPAAIADWRYVGVSVVAGLVTFWLYGPIARLWHAVLELDAAGLALFAVSGALKALSFGLNPLAAVLLGMLTGIGGGMLRDVLITEIPTSSAPSSTRSLAAAAVVVGGHELGLQSNPVALDGAAACFGLRLIAIWRGWEAPVAKQAESEEGT